MIIKKSRSKERFLCLNCGFLQDADVQASINIGMKGIVILGLDPTKLLMDSQEVTGKPETTGSSNREKSVALAVEPTNPRQLVLFEWIDGKAIYH